jgi:hypothetical protein
MSFWTYYSPSLLGAALALVLYWNGLQSMPARSPGLHVAHAAGWAVAAAAACQLLMIGAQGAFAQVLPAPGGRSIRGRGAVVCGASILAGGVLGAAAALLYAERLAGPGLVAAIAAGACATTAAIAYFWSMPIAVADFGRER